MSASKLYVEEWGEGDRVAVALHGLSSSARTWAGIAPTLVAQGYRVIAADLTGHGRSPRESYSRERWADQLLETLPAQPDLALGHSLGGVLLAMIADQLQPARAVYVDPAWYPWDGAGYGTAQPSIRALQTMSDEELAAGHARLSAVALADRQREVREWDPDTTRMRYLETAYLPVFPVVPSLVLLADPSPVLAPGIAGHLADVGFELRTVPGTGHWVHLDDEAAALTAMQGWL